MKVLIITGNLAYPLIKSVVEDSSQDVIVHIADTQVAAFLTPRMIINEVKTYFKDQLDEIDLILVPGLIKKIQSLLSYYEVMEYGKEIWGRD